MKPASFSYHRPQSLDEALALLGEYGDDAKVIAGGQSLGPMMNMRLAQPAQLVDLNDLGALAYVRETVGAIEVGALTRHHELTLSALVRERCPLLAEAAAGIGHYAIRQRGTLGGSLAHADPAAQLPLVAVTLGAEIEVASRRGRRTMPAEALFVSVMTTSLDPDEIVTAVRFPVRANGEGAAFQAFSRRAGDFAIVSVAATLAFDGNRVSRLRLGVAGVEAVPRALHAIADTAGGQSADDEWRVRVAAAARREVSPEEGGQIPAEYRRELVEVLTAKALARATDRAKERRT